MNLQLLLLLLLLLWLLLWLWLLLLLLLLAHWGLPMRRWKLCHLQLPPGWLLLSSTIRWRLASDSAYNGFCSRKCYASMYIHTYIYILYVWMHMYKYINVYMYIYIYALGKTEHLQLLTTLIQICSLHPTIYIYIIIYIYISICIVYIIYTERQAINKINTWNSIHPCLGGFATWTSWPTRTRKLYGLSRITISPTYPMSLGHRDTVSGEGSSWAWWTWRWGSYDNDDVKRWGYMSNGAKFDIILSSRG